MRTFTLLIIVVLIGAIYVVSAQDSGDGDGMLEDVMDETVNDATESCDKKGGGKRFGRTKCFMKQACEKFNKKKDKMGGMKGKGKGKSSGKGKMMEKMMAKCDEVKDGKDTEEGDSEFLNQMMKGGKDSKGGGGRGGKMSKIREKFQKYMGKGGKP